MNPEQSVMIYSPLPLYLQIKESLRESILNGTYAPHSKLPSENQLIRKFNVSRVTVRQALRDLQKEGLIFSVQGKGSFVTKPRAVQDLTRLQGFAEAMSQNGQETHSKVVSISTVAADETIAATLQVAQTSEVVEIQRIRYLNRTPVSLDISYFNPHIGKRLCQEDLVSRDIFSILENDYNYPLESADLTIDAVIADEDKAQLLQLEPGSALLRIERLTYSSGHVPVDYEFLYYIGDVYKYRLSVARNNY